MRVFERIGRMVRADAHGVMDQLEEGSLVLRQHLREAEIEVARKRAALEAIDEERTALREEGERLEAQVASANEDVELAMVGDDDNLARFAIRRILPKQAALQELFIRASEIDSHRSRAADQLEEQVAQLDELRPLVRARLARWETEGGSFERSEPITDEEVELEMLRRRTRKSAATESGAKIGGTR
jgi:phage shock protein A